VPQETGAGFGSYLTAILPADIAIACGAFSVSMQQIKNISQVDIEKFAQVVQSLETVRDLDIGGTNVPVNTSLATVASSAIAKGTGPNSTFTAGNFFGSMSGTNYNVSTIGSAISKLNTATLATIYDSMITLLSGLGPYDAALQALIINANTEINNILAAQPTEAQYLNSLWNSLGTELTAEQVARQTGLPPIPTPDPDFPVGSSPESQIGFLELFERFALDVSPSMWSQTLEAIANWNTTGGQSIVGLLREIRNKHRLQKIGVELDNTIPDTFSLQETITQISNGKNYLMITTPTPAVLTPQPYGYYDPAEEEYILADTNYGGPKILDFGGPMVPGSLAGSQYQNIVTPNLNTIYASKQLTPSTYSVPEAIEEVDLCNCECWDIL
jgi:hypothetical protein